MEKTSKWKHGTAMDRRELTKWQKYTAIQLVQRTLNSGLSVSIPMLIRSSVFHYELETIHPFADGNGRMGRLWQSLILARLNPVFQHLPVESMVHDNQQRYYEAINASTEASDSGIFIDFMLQELLQALKEHQLLPGGVNGGVNDGVTPEEVSEFIRRNPGLRANAIAAALAIPARSLERHLKRLREENVIEFRGAPRNGGYFRKEEH